MSEAAAIDATAPNSIADVARVRGLLLAAARGGEAISYSHLLNQLGHRFTRPKMRAGRSRVRWLAGAGLVGRRPRAVARP
jgi:hypothetical protein